MQAQRSWCRGGGDVVDSGEPSFEPFKFTLQACRPKSIDDCVIKAKGIDSSGTRNLRFTVIKRYFHNGGVSIRFHRRFTCKLQLSFLKDLRRSYEVRFSSATMMPPN
jgi:hypothetical protein